MLRMKSHQEEQFRIVTMPDERTVDVRLIVDQPDRSTGAGYEIADWEVIGNGNLSARELDFVGKVLHRGRLDAMKWWNGRAA